MEFCYYILGGVGFALVLNFIFELQYFLRTCLSVIWSRFFKKRVHILEQTKISGVCLTTDIDNLLNHMNNARYIRELDFAKMDFNMRTGLYRCIRSQGGSLVLGATTVRYRKFIKIFTRYVITTKILYWDDQSIYMEHRFITPSDNNFVNAIVLCKTRLVNCNAEEVIKELLTKSNRSDSESALRTKPEMSAELEKWIESNEISSAALRNNGIVIVS